MKDITSNDWEDLVKNGHLVLVDFWAPWCQPCKMMLPVLTQLEEQVANLTVLKVNADEELGLVKAFDISSIPTMLVFKNGELVKTIQGAKPFAALVQEIAPHV